MIKKYGKQYRIYGNSVLSPFMSRKLRSQGMNHHQVRKHAVSEYFSNRKKPTSIIAFAASEQGTKKTNEDSFCIYSGNQMIISDQSDYETYELRINLNDETCMAAVADGISSLYESDKTSDFLIRTLIDRYPSISLEHGKYIRRTLQSISGMIDMQNEDGHQRGTTGALIYIENDDAYCANVGDTAIYLFRNNNLRQISIEDTAAAKLLASGADKDSIDASCYHELTQFIGQTHYPEPHLAQLKLKCGDILIVMSDAFSPDAYLLKQLTKKAGNPAEGLIERFRKSRMKAYMDNSTVIILKMTDRASGTGD